MCYGYEDDVQKQGEIRTDVQRQRQEAQAEEHRQPVMVQAEPMEAAQQVQAPEANILQDFEIVEMEEAPRSVRERLQCKLELSEVIDERKDSPYMQAVKQAVGELSRLTEGNILENGNVIRLEQDGDALHQRLNEIEGKYMAAIEKCQVYLEKREPSFVGPKTRYNTVKNTMKLLQQELDYMSKLRLDMAKNPGDYEGYVNMPLLDLIYNLRIRKELDQGTDQLDLKDFAQMITKNEEDEILCRNGKLYRRGEMKADEEQGSLTQENFQMADRMVRLLLERQELSGPEQKERMRRNILRGLGADVKNQVSGPLGMSRIRELLVKFNRYTSKVDQVLQEQKANAKLSKEEQSREYRSARQIEELLGNAFDDKLTKQAKKKEYTRKSRAFQDFVNRKILRKKDPSVLARLELEAKMKEQIRGILKTCEKNKDWTILHPSDKDLETLLHGRMQAVRDKAYETAQQIYAARERLQQKPVQELDNREMQELMGLLLTEAMAGSEEAKLAANLQLQKYTESRILNADLELEKSLGAMSAEELEGVPVSEIRSYVLANPKRWKGMSQADREAALAAVLRIVGNMQEIRLLSHKGLLQGLSEEEAATLKKRAEENYALYTAGEKQIEKLQKGFPANSALHQGLKKLKTKKLSHFGALAAEVAGQKLRKAQEQAPEEEKKNKPIEAMTEAEALKFAMHDFDGKAISVLTSIFLDQQPSKLIKRAGDRRSEEILQLHDALQAMALLGEEQKKAEMTVTLNGVRMRVRQDAAGILTLSVGSKEVTLPRNAGYLADMLERNLCDHFDSYDKAHARGILLQAVMRDDAKYSAHGGSRVIYERFLTYHIGISAEKLANVDAYVLRNLTKKYCTDPETFSKEEIAKLADAYAKRQIGKVHINSSAAIENLIAMEDLKQAKKEAQVRREEHAEKAKPLAVREEKEEWSPAEKSYLNLVSDLLFLKKTKEAQDLENPLTAESLKKVLLTRKKELVTVLNMNALERLAIRKQLEIIPNFGKAAAAADDLIAKLIDKEQTGRYVMGIFLMGEAKEENIEDALEDPELTADLESCAEKMKEAVNDASAFIQKTLKSVADSLGDDADDSWKHLSDYTIGELVQKGITGDEGEGAFNRKVLSGYIEKAAFSDKVRMVSAALRNMPKLSANSLRRLGEEGIAAKIMAGYIKGAGPLLHKMMQGLPISSMDESMQEMVGDVRSRLMEIDEDLVDGQLQQIIRESNGSIEHIDMIKVLGAASVGQTVLVKVYEKGKTEGTEKVVKILRPDVQNYMERERAFMEDCAKEVDREAYIRKHGAPPAEDFKGGMLKTYLGKEKAILRELDLRLEADNVEKGSIYEDELLHIRSMKLDANTKSTVQTIVLEKADGVSVDKFMDKKNEDRENLEKTATKAEDKSKVHIYQSIEELSALREELKTKQQYLINLTSKWLDEAIFNTGFFHGDLHAGNVMIDDEGVTIIDYGNASKLTPKEQTSILNLLAAAARFNNKRVASHIRSMLSPEAKRIYDSKRTTLEDNIRTIVKKEGGMPVQTVLAVLNELQKEEIEIPEGLYNFIQCFVRIFGTLTDYKNLIANVDESIENVMQSEQRGDVVENPENDIMMPIMNKLLIRVDKKKKDRPEAKESLENIVKTAMANKEVNMDLLQYYCDTKQNPVLRGFEKIQKEQAKMPDVADLITRINEIYMPLFYNEDFVRAIHDLRYAENFDIQDGINVEEWFNLHVMMQVETQMVLQVQKPIEKLEKKKRDAEERKKTLQDPEGIAACDREIAECDENIAAIRSRQASLRANADGVKAKMTVLHQQMQQGELDREALKNTIEEAYGVVKEMLGWHAKDDEEKEFISALIDLSATTRPKKLKADQKEEEKPSEKLKADQKEARRKLERIANVIHRRSDPKSYAEEMADAVIGDESYVKLGQSLKDWFENSETHGEELHTAYLNVGAAKQRGPVDAASPEVKAFIEALRVSLTDRSAQIEKIADEKNRSDESGSEEKAIEDLLHSNMVMSVLSLDGNGLPYIFEHKMKTEEKQRLAADKKNRKTQFMERFYNSLSSAKLGKATRNLSEATKQYNRIMGLLNGGRDELKPSEAQLDEAVRMMNDNLNAILREIAKITFYPAEQKKIDKGFKNMETNPEPMDFLRLLREVGNYIEDSLEDTAYMDANYALADGAVVRGIDLVYNHLIKEWDIIPQGQYAGKLKIDEKLGADGKPIPLKERLLSGEKINWIQKKEANEVI